MTIKSTNCHLKISWNTAHYPWCNHKLNQSKFSISCLGSSLLYMQLHDLQPM